MSNRIVGVFLLLLAAPAFAGWEEPFANAVRNCDRVRIRSGGTCHRDVEAERTLCELTKPPEIRALVKGLEIDEAASGFGCMCCGEPTFEFYRGERLLAMVGFHHGQSLRWDGGAWAGDAALTTKSAEFLCRWLAEHGVGGPLAEWEENRARKRAEEERMRRYAAILPPESYAALAAARSPNECAAALGSAHEDPVERVLLCLRVYGCHEGSWTHYTPIDSAALSLLKGAPPEALGGGLARLGGAPGALNGAARFLFGDRCEEKVPREALVAALPALAAHAFAHPRREVRHSAMDGVFRVGGPAAVAALRPVLEGKVEIRELPETDRVDPGGMVRIVAGRAEIRGATDDRVVAGILLLLLRARECLPAVRALRDEVEGRDRELLDAALAAADGGK